MARRLYEEWFVRFRFPGHEQVRMVDSPLGKVPEGWKVGRLDDVLVLQRGFDLPNVQRASRVRCLSSQPPVSMAPIQRQKLGDPVL